MKGKYVRWGFISILIICAFSLLFSCTSNDGDGTPAEPTAAITLECAPDKIPADGYASSTIKATLINSTGQPRAKGTSVIFHTSLGTFSNHDTSYSVATQDHTGIVMVSLIAGTTPGVAKITVESQDTWQSITVEFTHAGNTGVPAGEEFSLCADFRNISGLWVCGLEDVITATVGDAFGNAVKDSTLIHFKTYNTGGYLDIDMAATISGVASSKLISAENPAPLQGFVSVTAEADGGPTTRITSLAVTPYPDNYIIYAGTNGGGVYKSTDYGVNWENISRSSLNPRQGQNWIDPYIKGNSAICVDPDDHNTVYVGTGYLGKGNVYRSLDGGMNWNSNNVEEWNGMFPTTAAVLTVLCDDGGSDYVWIGTEGRGALFATDGENFQPACGIVNAVSPTEERPGPPPYYINHANTGNGAMSIPLLWYSSQTETWTATCFVPANSTATVPKRGEDNQGNGWMSNVETSATTKAEEWTVTYSVTAGPVASTGTGDGTLFGIEVKEQNAATETWTLTCFDSTADEEIFTVKSNVRGFYPNAVVGTKYDEDTISFTITPGSVGFIVGDTLTFITTTDWRVAGTFSGVQTKTATTGTTYTSDNGEVQFTITADGAPFAVGDTFTFSTTAASTPYWNVSGSESGLQNSFAQTSNQSNTYPYRSDNYEVRFTITERTIPFAHGDTFKFHVTASDITHGWTVWDIVKVPVPDYLGDNAILYAGTATGVFKSTNGGRTWYEPGSFTGDFILSLALHPTSTGADSDVIYAGTQNSGVWVSIDSGKHWINYPGGMGLVGQSATIKDLLVDSVNNQLYAITYEGPLNQAKGNVYVHALNADGSIPTGDWVVANTGLPGDGLHSITIDNPASPAALYLGGEGISFYNATNGLDTGNPVWQESNTGLSNVIMARMPILFSGECAMSVERVIYENIVWFRVYIEDINGNPPITGSKFTATYIPEGALVDESEKVVYRDIEYADTYTSRGTFSDPSNPFTNNPYEFWVTVSSGDKVEFVFTPANTLPDAPGSSGSERTLTYLF